jgi:tetratricopeptide (TPR) repeat protein
MILPVGGAVHAGFHLVADRYSYFSGFGFAVLAGGGLAWLVRERTRLRSSVVTFGVVAAALIVIGWGAGAWRQSKMWHDSERLWDWALELDPQCVVCATNLGGALILAPEPGLARARQAEALFRYAIRLRPERALTYHSLGVALARQGRYAEAETVFEEYARRDQGSVMASEVLGVVRLQQGRYAEAIPLLRRALAIDPAYPNLRPALARALRERSEALRREGKAGEADALVDEARAVLAGTPAQPRR